MELVLPAFLAGIFTFLAPCTLPLLPGYLAFISGVSTAELDVGQEAARKKIFKNGLLFVLGFSLVFIMLGILAGVAGQLLVPVRLWLVRISGVLVIMFGLFMLETVKIPLLSYERKFQLPLFFHRGKLLGALLLGAAFGFGWTPCIGPILGSILLVASTQGSALQGTILLTVFSAGLALPFLIFAWWLGRARSWVKNLSRFSRITSIVGGVFLVFLGLLLFFDQMGLLLSYGFRLLDIFDYEKFINKFL